jgi:hypothetical protein
MAKYSSAEVSSQFLRDLKHSRFFKIYFGLGLFLAFFFVFGFFVAAIRAAVFDVATGWRFYLAGYDQMQYPGIINSSIGAKEFWLFVFVVLILFRCCFCQVTLNFKRQRVLYSLQHLQIVLQM